MDLWENYTFTILDDVDIDRPILNKISALEYFVFKSMNSQRDAEIAELLVGHSAEPIKLNGDVFLPS